MDFYSKAVFLLILLSLNTVGNLELIGPWLVSILR